MAELADLLMAMHATTSGIYPTCLGLGQGQRPKPDWSWMCCMLTTSCSVVSHTCACASQCAMWTTNAPLAADAVISQPPVMCLWESWHCWESAQKKLIKKASPHGAPPTSAWKRLPLAIWQQAQSQASNFTHAHMYRTYFACRLRTPDTPLAITNQADENTSDGPDGPAGQ
ncbi:hypothetical protein GQ54DRAFT_57233 [Martensiomyces pterosporus]|nr:hypothetical protein GQ54DRAFT_57233 [Martensiomyces pterosporus]